MTAIDTGGAGIMRERRIVFGLDDLRMVRLKCALVVKDEKSGECSPCPGEVIFPLDSKANPPEKCPSCTNRWSTGALHQQRTAETQLLCSMRQLLHLNSNLTVRFEIDDR